MLKTRLRTFVIVAALFTLALWSFAPPAEAAPKKGGVLKFVVGSKIPSYDGHIESTFGMIHPLRPFYSLLIRVNPDNPSSPTDFICDVCEGGVPTPTEGHTKYTFKIRKDITFHNGQKLTSADVKATYDKIISPPKGIESNRKAFFSMVKSVTAPDAETLVFKLKYPTGAFVPALALPYNFIYSKADLDKHGYRWHQKNVNGTGAFRFVQHQPGAFVEGKRYEKYHHEGKPYLDGYRAISAPKMAIRLQAIRGDRAAIEFRGFPPKARDDLKNALGDKLTVQESDWNCNLMVTPNHKRKPFDDARVRRALTLAIDRWGGSKYLSRIAIVKTVGGVVFPKHPLAATKEELTKIAGYWPDINKSRAEAKRLLKEAGYPERLRVHPAQPGRGPALQGRGHLGHRPVAENRTQGQAVGAAFGAFLRHAQKEEELRRVDRLQLPVGHQPAGGRVQIHLRRQGGQPVRAIPGSPARQVVRRDEPRARREEAGRHHAQV